MAETLKRYTYEPGMIDGTEVYRLSRYDDYDDIPPPVIRDREGYKIFDNRAGHSDDVWVAFSRDRGTAQLLVDLLNKHDQVERTRAAINAWMAEPTNIREGIDYDD